MSKRAIIALASIIVGASAHAQCTPSPTNFCVTQGTKTAGHPNPGGFPAAWYINGVEAPALTLVRGTTYTFKMNTVPSLHPFYVTTSSVGGFGAPAWTDGTTPSGGVFGNATMTFAVSAAAPDLLYYNCHNHDRMGWKLIIVDPPCPADYNGDTEPDILDFLDFFDDFGACENQPVPCGSFGDPDINADGLVDVLDFLDFFDAFGSGC